MVRWTITKDNLAQLDTFQDIEAGTLELHSEVAGDDLKRVVRFVREHGELLHTFIQRPKSYLAEKVDLGDFDLATGCPHLQTFDVKRFMINASIFAHPTLEILRLWESDYRGPREITLGDGLSERDGCQLKDVGIMDCQMPTDALTIGSASQLKVFRYFLDEDAAEPDVLPQDFVFKACSQLELITIHACGSWKIRISGELPRLGSISLNATEYGSYRCEIEGVDERRKAEYQRMIEVG